MTAKKVPEPDKVEQAPELTQEQLEAAVLHLLAGSHNTVAALLARPEQIQTKRERFARALRNEEVRLAEAPLNRLRETARRNG